MLVIVSSVSLLVQIYSVGYMHGDDRFRWYYGAISLFTAAMLGVVIADDWLLMYMCWEVMGLASYLLIGFWYETEAAPPAAMKAFLVTRFGDVGFGLALVMIWLNTGTFRFEEVFGAVESGAWVGPTLVVASLLLLAGAMGKSAQFPLHIWLPDAMAGPTPGSALIHAATMVAAGVYLVARSFPLYEANPATLTVIGTIGAITALLGALIALAMNDIKKVLAYSTISQLGLMFLALGTGSWVAAIFHLTTHAFFKALLFLGRGFGHPRHAHSGPARDGRLVAQDAVDDGHVGGRDAGSCRHTAAGGLLEQGRDPARRVPLGSVLPPDRRGGDGRADRVLHGPRDAARLLRQAG